VSWIAEGISRELALSVPACAACRNLVVGTATQITPYRYRGGERLDPGWLLTRPDPSMTWPATLAGTVDDLAFHGRAYWRVLDRDPEGFPRRARWTPYLDVTPETVSTGGSWQELTGYRIAGVGQVAVADVIRFDSPLPAILVFGAPTFAQAIANRDKARRLASTDLPAGVLTNEGTELGDDEAADLIAKFQAARANNGVAFLQGMSYSKEASSAADSELVAQQSDDATNVARLWNVPVAMVGASPSGNASALLYSNLSQQLAILVSSAVQPYLRAIEETLSDVTPTPQSVAFDVQTFLRSDPQAAADYAIALYGAGIITLEEARGYLGVPASAAPDLAPGKV